MEWSRKAELSADRAGLLATQDPAAATRVHMKLASAAVTSTDLDATSFFAQGSEYDETEDLRDSVLKVLLSRARRHPFAVVRAAELRRGSTSGDYTAILGGAYPAPRGRRRRTGQRRRAGGRGRATPRRSSAPRTRWAA